MRCEECGFEYSSVGRDEVPDRLRAAGPAYAERLAADELVLRQRPAPDVWSALEYACHVRDVLQVQRERLALALTEDRPTFVPMGRDERVVNDRYNEQDPKAVSHELRAAANEIADAFTALDDPGWDRVGIYNYPEPAERSMLWLAQHTIHETEHHLTDVDTALAAAEPG
jgi:S-DNA-T family DNA segregation ATPase FtsK/SpoIIIE